MDDSEDNMSTEDVKGGNSPLTVKVKPKKRSLVERELETSLTARVTSPVTNGEGLNTSRYGRARRIKRESENIEKKLTAEIKSPPLEKSPMKSLSPAPVYKMHASNSPLRAESPKMIPTETYLETQIENIYQENISLSRFSTEEEANPSPAKKFPKVYIRKDLIQKREADETVILIKNMFSPSKSGQKNSNSHLNNILERSSERYNLSSGKPQNGYLDNSSVVKTLDFDSKRKKKQINDSKSLSKNELFELEAKCPYQVGDLAWARMGTYPFWPSIVTRDPTHGVFVKKKLFGRIERDVIHVTFFGDNGRRGWIVDSMLRRYLGQLEFETTRENFTPEDKKKDPRLYAAYFVSEKKQALWNTSVEEAEMLLREPKRLRIDIFHDMLEKCRGPRPRPSKSGKITRTDSDVSLSESLYDSLFSEDDGKTDNTDRSRNMSRNKSLDVSDVVTACLDNMAAKTGITKIQRQSHMDRWLQKAKSKTPEKIQVVAKVEKEKGSNKKSKKSPCKKVRVQSAYSLRRSNHESRNLLPFQNEHDYSKITNIDDSEDTDNQSVDASGIGIISKVESLSDKSHNDSQEIGTEESATDSEDHKESMDANDTCDTIESENRGDESKVTDTIDTIEAPNIEVPVSNDITTDSVEPRIKATKDMTIDSDQEKLEEPYVSNDIVIETAKARIKSPNIPNDITTDSEQADISMEIEQSELQTNNANLDEINSITSQDKKMVDVNVTNEENNDSKSQIQEITKGMTACTNKQHDNEDSNEKCVETNEIVHQAILNGHRHDAATEIKNEDDKMDTATNNHDEKNMSFDYDSDSSAPLPYSPLSVDLNKDKSRLEELADLMKDQDWNEPEKPTEKDHEILNDDIPETCLNNNLNSLEEYKNMISDFDNHGRDICDNYDSKAATGKYVTKNHHDIHKKCDTIDKQTPIKEINDSSLLKQENSELSIAQNLDKLKTKPMKDISLASEPQHDVAMENGHENEESNHIDSKERNNEQINKIKEKTAPIDINISKEIINLIDKDYPVTETSVLNGYADDTQRNLNSIKKHNNFISEPVKENGYHEGKHKNDYDIETASIHSEDSIGSSKSESRRKLRSRDKKQENPLDNPEFVKYMELRQDAIMDENPELSQNEIVAYLHKTWLYEENLKTDTKKNDDLIHQNFVKGLNKGPARPARKKTLSLKINRMNFFPRTKCKEDSKDTIKELPKETVVPENSDVNKDSTKSKAVSPIDEQLESIQGKEPSISKENEIDSVSISSCDSTLDKRNENVDAKDKTDVISLDTADFDDEKHIGPTKFDEVKKEIVQERDTDYRDYDGDSIDSEDSETPLIRCKLRLQKYDGKETSVDKVKKEKDADAISINSEDSEVSIGKRKKKKSDEKTQDDPEFVKYLELRRDALIDENPQLTHEEIVTYLYQTWLYEDNAKSDLKRSDELEQSSLVKGLNENVKQSKKVKRNKIKTEKETVDDDVIPKEKPKRKIIKTSYNEEYSDIEDEIEYFEIFKAKNKTITPKVETPQAGDDKTIEGTNKVEATEANEDIVEVYDEVEQYFEDLTTPKPNIFKGLIREKVCEICENTGNLAKCKGCNGMFHLDCVNKETQVVEVQVPTRGRKKKKKSGRKPKSLEDSENHDDGSDQNASIEDIMESEYHTVDADVLEAELATKIKEMIENSQPQYDSYSSDDGIDWNDTVPGKCEIIDIKLKPRNSQVDYSNFKCKNCQKYETPVCFVCKNAVSKSESAVRQKCHVAHCNKYYHLECLDIWPQTQFNGGEPSRNNKKINEYFEAITCPRHVCHTCVSDDPRGCKTRFSGDKLAKCVRCPATYHSFTKCLPAGTQILTASHIICPRHYEHRPGKIPCHVNTGWCFICALGGSLICCEYCPTSFHAECLNIKPPEGGYMCEDCETGRLPLYGEMVWVKLGHYRWWPGIVLHPTEIPENILAVKHSPGEFVVRFFGQYDHYWVNRGRVFPFQEGDSGRISSQKSKIDAAFTTAMEHAQRACEILKTAQPYEEESLDIASSLLPPHYVKLKVNKPCGSLCGRRLEDPESSLTQCECNPLEDDPCGPYSQCLNRMLLTECGPTCRAGDRCNNRAFEKRLYPKLVPYRTPSRGWGLKTLEDIKAGQFVIEYVGELLDEEEFRRRMARMHDMRDENFYFLTLDKERMIDAGPKGNLARFMNHCCEPNCETQKWTVLGDVRVGLFALKDIPANSEVTFNYNLECAGIDKKRCMCGAKRCSGYIGAKPKQDDQSKKPKLPGKRTYKKRKNNEDSPSTSENKPKRPKGRPPKPRELSEIEKDLLIIKNATNGLSSDESCRSLSLDCDRTTKALKRKRVSFSTEEVILFNAPESPSAKKAKTDTETCVGD